MQGGLCPSERRARLQGMHFSPQKWLPLPGLSLVVGWGCPLVAEGGEALLGGGQGPCPPLGLAAPASYLSPISPRPSGRCCQ